MDVVEIWEVLRSTLDNELRDTPLENELVGMFGPRRNRMTNMPTYKAPARGSKTIQGAIDQAVNLVDTSHQLPLILQIELDRQEFDEKSRTWKKVSDRVKLDEVVQVGDTTYNLFGFVVHKEALQSGLYNSYLRPDGPGTKWFTFKDNRDESQVHCVPKREAIDKHEGTESGKDSPTAHVAYVVTYVQAKCTTKVFGTKWEPEWKVPQELVDEIEKEQAFQNQDIDMLGLVNPMNPIPPAAKDDAKPEAPPEPLEFTIFSSKVFQVHQGPGIIHYFDPKWNSSPDVLKITLNSTDTPVEARDKIAAMLPDVKDPRQVKYWSLSYVEGASFKPHLITTGKTEISAGNMELDLEWDMGQVAQRTCERRLWLHVVDEADLPPLPKEPVVATMPNGQPIAPPSPPPAALTNGNDQALLDQTIPPPEPTEDTAMGGAEDDTNQITPPPPAPVEENSGELPPPIPPPTDTEMNDDAIPPPIDPQVIPSPPQLDLAQNRPPSPPPPGPPPFAPVPLPAAVSEVYFFLKIFDAEAQTLIPYGSYLVKRNARVDHTVHKILGTPKDQSLILWEEEHISCARQLRRRKTFNEEDLHNSDIIIAQVPASEEVKTKNMAQAAYSDPNTYLYALAEARNFPDLVTGHFTLDYFSSEYFSGSMRARQPHGEGKKIYHNGNTYVGSFQLGQRHGHGVMTFQNGDTYEGNWENGMQHGQGTYVEKETGNTYVGGWKNDKRHGEGVTHWKIAQETERMCRICWEENAEAAFYDCGHVVACINCARRVESCPVCRKRVLSAIKLFYAS
jgi:hypothetical protein